VDGEVVEDEVEVKEGEGEVVASVVIAVEDMVLAMVVAQLLMVVVVAMVPKGRTVVPMEEWEEEEVEDSLDLVMEEAMEVEQ
jgi:hypothetical protein